MSAAEEVKQKLSRVKLIAMDVDGVLTDGGICYSGTNDESKTFNVMDGLGIRLALLAGIPVAWITGRTSDAVVRRSEELSVTHLYTGILNKSVPLAELMSLYSLDASQIAYMGDDLNDLPAFSLAGVKFAPSNATIEIKSLVDFVTERAGGAGAVREFIDSVLKAQDKWTGAVEAFLAEALKPADSRS